MRTIRIALTGELDESAVAHRAVPRALALGAAAVGCRVQARWIASPELLPDPGAVLESFDGHWCVPGSPYASEAGALAGIAESRRAGRPFLGTCGGFQHALLEYARDVLGLVQAAHEQTSPNAATLLLIRLRLSLAQRDGRVYFSPGSRVARAYGRLSAIEGYDCDFGLNADFRGFLEMAGMRMSAVDETGDVRAVELPRHPFFVATLFQPERSALAAPRPHPLVAAFVEAARARAAGQRRSAGPAGGASPEVPLRVSDA